MASTSSRANVSDEAKGKEEKSDNKGACQSGRGFSPIAARIQGQSLTILGRNEICKSDLNTISINDARVDKTDIDYIFLLSHRINISSARSIADSAHARTLGQTQ